MILDDMAATASMQADRTAESESRRRRSTVATILERKGASASPWKRVRSERRLTHCLRTGDLEEESVLWMQERKEENESGLKVLAMDSSSAAATASVSRSESLLSSAMTRCRRS